MKMELFYVAEIKEKISFDDNTPKTKVAEFIAGPFGEWNKASQAKEKAEANRIGHPDIRIVTQTIEVNAD